MILNAREIGEVIAQNMKKLKFKFQFDSLPYISVDEVTVQVDQIIEFITIAWIINLDSLTKKKQMLNLVINNHINMLPEKKEDSTINRSSIYMKLYCNYYLLVGWIQWAQEKEFPKYCFANYKADIKSGFIEGINKLE
jgi:hypothetical protein